MRSRSTSVGPNAFPVLSDSLSLDTCRSKCVTMFSKSLSLDSRRSSIYKSFSGWIRRLIFQQAQVLWFESIDFSFKVRVHRTMNSYLFLPDLHLVISMCRFESGATNTIVPDVYLGWILRLVRIAWFEIRHFSFIVRVHRMMFSYPFHPNLHLAISACRFALGVTHENVATGCWRSWSWR